LSINIKYIFVDCAKILSGTLYGCNKAYENMRRIDETKGEKE